MTNGQKIEQSAGGKTRQDDRTKKQSTDKQWMKYCTLISKVKQKQADFQVATNLLLIIMTYTSVPYNCECCNGISV